MIMIDSRTLRPAYRVFQELILDLPAVRLFILTGISLILRRVDFNTSKLETGSGYSRGYLLAKCSMALRSAARKPEVGS